MIVKEFEFKNLNPKNYNFYLLHGNNEGLKNEILSQLALRIQNEETQKFEEKEILENLEWFKNEVFSGSLFSAEKLIIINRASDKILQIIEDIYTKKINGLTVIIIANTLEKKSKLRFFFEKKKE